MQTFKIEIIRLLLMLKINSGCAVNKEMFCISCRQENIDIKIKQESNALVLNAFVFKPIN